MTTATITEYRIIWGHSGRRGEEWNTAQEASRYSAMEWGKVEATCVGEAMTIVEREGLDWGDFWHDGDGNIHVI